MDYGQYLIKKGKVDLLSSLKLIDKKIINSRLEEENLDTIGELKDRILEDFEYCLHSSKDDIFTQMYFADLLQNENSTYLSSLSR